MTTGGGDPVGDGRSGCHTTVALNTLDPRGSLPFATIEELPHDVNAMLGLVVSQWNQNWALETWNAVQVMASAGFQTFNPLTIRLRRVEVGGMTGNQVNVLDVDSLNNFVTHLEVLDQNNVIVRVEPNVNMAQLLQLGIATEVSNSGSRRLRLSLGSSDANPTFVDLPTTAILTLRYGVNAKLAANATTGARGWVSIFPCIDRGNEF